MSTDVGQYNSDALKRLSFAKSDIVYWINSSEETVYILQRKIVSTYNMCVQISIYLG